VREISEESGFYYVNTTETALSDVHLQLCDPVNDGRPGLNFVGLRSVRGTAEISVTVSCAASCPAGSANRATTAMSPATKSSEPVVLPGGAGSGSMMNFSDQRLIRICCPMPRPNRAYCSARADRRREVCRLDVRGRLEANCRTRRSWYPSAAKIGTMLRKSLGQITTCPDRDAFVVRCHYAIWKSSPIPQRHRPIGLPSRLSSLRRPRTERPAPQNPRLENPRRTHSCTIALVILLSGTEPK
jgi:hypothetical protein